MKKPPYDQDALARLGNFCLEKEPDLYAERKKRAALTLREDVLKIAKKVGLWDEKNGQVTRPAGAFPVFVVQIEANERGVQVVAPAGRLARAEAFDEAAAIAFDPVTEKWVGTKDAPRPPPQPDDSPAPKESAVAAVMDLVVEALGGRAVHQA